MKNLKWPEQGFVSQERIVGTKKKRNGVGRGNVNHIKKKGLAQKKEANVMRAILAV